MLRPIANEVRISQANRIATPAHNLQPTTIQRARLRWQSLAGFSKQVARQPQSTGAIAPSSRLLARQVVQNANLSQAQTVVELGPGTGAFTEEILKQLNPEALFFALELNRVFVEATRNRCPEARVYHDAASSLPEHLLKNKRSHADCIISSLPWTIFNETEQNNILNAITNSLKPGGVLVSIVYLGASFRSRGRCFINNLDVHFSSFSHTHTVWQNLPPAKIYRCIK